jgi:hypothetical protein
MYGVLVLEGKVSKGEFLMKWCDEVEDDDCYNEDATLKVRLVWREYRRAVLR